MANAKHPAGEIRLKARNVRGNSRASEGVSAGNKRNRSAEVVAALRKCMLERGYADTSLTDLANMASLSVSHLLYYYPNKDAVLLDLARDLHQRVLTRVGEERGEPPEERIHLLVDNMFVGVSRGELSLLREIIALASYRPALQQDVEEYARSVRAYFEDIFEQTPRQPGMSASDAADLAGALWMGLMINTSFQNQLDERQARRLFRKALLSLANISPEDDAPSRKTRKTKRS